MRTGCVAPNRPGLGGLEGCLFQRWKRRSFFPVALLGVPLSQDQDPDPASVHGSRPNLRQGFVAPTSAQCPPFHGEAGGEWEVVRDATAAATLGLTTTSTRSSRSVCRKS